jgi:hypothetical protein
MARQIARFFGDFRWALTLADHGDHEGRIVLRVGFGLDH